MSQKQKSLSPGGGWVLVNPNISELLDHKEENQIPEHVIATKDENLKCGCDQEVSTMV